MIPDARALGPPRITRIPGATIVPMTPGGGHACGVLDAAGAAVPAARTLLSGGRFTPDPAPPAETPEHLPGRWLLAGVGRHHFGHFLLEATPRLWALDHGARPVDGIVLVPMQGRDIAAVLRRRLGPLMDMLGQGLPVHLPEMPTRVDELVVPSQGFGHLHWSAGTPEARAYMRRHLCGGIAPDGPERLYVSRRRLKGLAREVPEEGRLERWLARAGYGILHPERHAISEQIACYRAARVIVGPDGSAFHLAAMVMRPGARVGLIRRRTRQPVIDAISNQIRTFAGTDPWISRTLVQPPSEAQAAQDRDAADCGLHGLRADLQAAGFL